MSELPRLYDLIRLADVSGNNRFRVLERLERNRRGQELAYEIKSASLTTISDLFRKPTSTRGGEISARRVCNKQIPAKVDHIENITLDVMTLSLRWQKVTANGVKTNTG